MRIELRRYTCDPDLLSGEAAALCTGYEGDPLMAEIGAMSSGHESVIEHATFTFLIQDVSRVLLAQLTRHRLASFSVQSQRYCGAQTMVIIPDTVMERPEVLGRWMAALDMLHSVYDYSVQQGVPQEDARYISAQGTATKLMMTMNGRELRHFLSLRMCNRAQWEIRALADAMYKEVKRVAPNMMFDAGPGCMRGLCPEGKKSCGHTRCVEINGWEEQP